jgi:hypothetical protein
LYIEKPLTLTIEEGSEDRQSARVNQSRGAGGHAAAQRPALHSGARRVHQSGQARQDYARSNLVARQRLSPAQGARRRCSNCRRTSTGRDSSVR